MFCTSLCVRLNVHMCRCVYICVPACTGFFYANWKSQTVSNWSASSLRSCLVSLEVHNVDSSGSRGGVFLIQWLSQLLTFSRSSFWSFPFFLSTWQLLSTAVQVHRQPQIRTITQANIQNTNRYTLTDTSSGCISAQWEGEKEGQWGEDRLGGDVGKEAMPSALPCHRSALRPHRIQFHPDGCMRGSELCRTWPECWWQTVSRRLRGKRWNRWTLTPRLRNHGCDNMRSAAWITCWRHHTGESLIAENMHK